MFEFETSMKVLFGLALIAYLIWGLVEIIRIKRKTNKIIKSRLDD